MFQEVLYLLWNRFGQNTLLGLLDKIGTENIILNGASYHFKGRFLGQLSYKWEIIEKLECSPVSKFL